jgi:hypothetical protein
MHSRYLQGESPWNTDLLLPLVEERSGLLEIQILLGGLSLVLSRLHPDFALSHFLGTRRIVMRLTRAVEYDDPTKAHFDSAELQQSLKEVGRALDPGTLLTLKKVLAATLKQEALAERHERQDDFTMSDYMAEEDLMEKQAQATSSRGPLSR